jgi:hypothetical protein
VKPAGQNGWWGRTRTTFDRTFTTNPTDKSSASGDRFYDKLNELELQFKKYGTKGEVPPQLQQFRKASERLSALRAMKDIVYNSDRFTAREKADLIPLYQRAITDIPRAMTGKDALYPDTLFSMVQLADTFSKYQSRMTIK